MSTPDALWRFLCDMEFLGNAWEPYPSSCPEKKRFRHHKFSSFNIVAAIARRTFEKFILQINNDKTKSSIRCEKLREVGLTNVGESLRTWEIVKLPFCASCGPYALLLIYLNNGDNGSGDTVARTANERPRKINRERCKWRGGESASPEWETITENHLGGQSLNRARARGGRWRRAPKERTEWHCSESWLKWHSR